MSVSRKCKKIVVSSDIGFRSKRGNDHHEMCVALLWLYKKGFDYALALYLLLKAAKNKNTISCSDEHGKKQ